MGSYPIQPPDFRKIEKSALEKVRNGADCGDTMAVTTEVGCQSGVP